jgi:hypothetical protein
MHIFQRLSYSKLNSQMTVCCVAYCSNCDMCRNVVNYRLSFLYDAVVQVVIVHLRIFKKILCFRHLLVGPVFQLSDTKKLNPKLKAYCYCQSSLATV